MEKEVVRFDLEKCIGCGACVRDCLTKHIELIGGKAALNDRRCIHCGHCFAVCPTEAVSMDGYDCDSCRDYLSPTELDGDKLLLAMKSRRSVRRFTEEKVSETDLQRIIEAGRCCPTGSNAQNVHFIILDKVKDEAERMAIDALLHLDWFSAMYKSVPDDFLFKGAPLVILTADSRLDNAALAASYMELEANALGLGVLYNGYFIGACNNYPPLRELVGLEGELKAVCCLVIGHPDPDIKYRRTAPRRKANVIVK